MHLPDLISDLAVMLLTAGAVTIIFRRINLPMVLGYILAGFLIGPYFSMFFTVADKLSVETWSEIGIIILMFSLGLEFNLHKLAEVGMTGVITALTEVGGMLLIGYAAGQALGWSVMDSVFLGGMLSMSSTTIIIKAFDELGIRKESFAELVFGTLVIEDIAGIFMMIILSTLSVSQEVSGVALAGKLGMLALYLAIWLIIGIYLLPTLLNKASSLMNDETLLIFSLGICFGMVLLADALGFSSALGAFLAGSLLAGTVHAERIEHLSSGVKDLFGAVFFLSVGMMIDPAMIVKYIVPILIISVIAVIGKLLMSTLGVLFAGKSLKDAVHCGCSLAQIGEFAFIIASLGLSLGVVAEYVYPIIVSVSVITTLTTPFFIKSADKIYSIISRILPASLVEKLSRYTEEESEVQSKKDSDWKLYLRGYLKNTFLFGIIMLAVAIIGHGKLLPLAEKHFGAGRAVDISCLALIWLLMALFIKPMLDTDSTQYTALWLKSRGNRLPLLALSALRVMTITMLMFIPAQSIGDINGIWLIIIILIMVFFGSRSRWLASRYLSVEARFLANFNERRLRVFEDSNKTTEWLDEKLKILEFFYEGEEKSLKTLDWGRKYGVNVVKIIRGKRHFCMPGARAKIKSGDKVLVIGEDKQINLLKLELNLESSEKLPSLREYITSENNAETDIFSYAMEIDRGSNLSGSSIKDCGLRDNYDCLILGIQRNNLPIVQPDPNMTIQSGDFVWILGTKTMAERVLMDVE